MTWRWTPKAWNGFADRALNTLIGCSHGCEYCWARRFYRRGLHGCSDCKAFRLHEHPERWKGFRAKPGQRIAWNYGGDMFDLHRASATIHSHLVKAAHCADTFGCKFLVQTRHVASALNFIGLWYKGFEIGTSFTGPDDVENVRALGELPDSVVRFIAFEPCDALIRLRNNELAGPVYEAIKAAKPHWAYIGFQTPATKKNPGYSYQHRQRIELLASWLGDFCCTVIFKKSCGPDLYKRNEGMTLP